MTFRPGQKVRIKDSVTAKYYPEVNNNFTNGMCTYKDTIYTIKRISYGQVFLLESNTCRYSWYDIWFEPAHTIIHTKAII